jgi:outer membrane protein assembly factor BamE (lipoprotein component of BamABCDE complex)
MEGIIFLLIVIIIFGALLGGKTFGGTVRKGCSLLLAVLLVLFGAYFFLNSNAEEDSTHSDTIPTIIEKSNYISKHKCALYEKADINSEVIRYIEEGEYFNVRDKDKFNYFYEVFDDDLGHCYILKDDLKSIKHKQSNGISKTTKQITNTTSPSQQKAIEDKVKNKEVLVLNKNYYSLGSTKDEVLAIQGTPTSLNQYGSSETWSYGAAHVEFKNGVVVSWSDVLGNTLKVRMESENSYTHDFYTKGSTKDEVLAIQGTPSSLNQYGSSETWSYGAAYVEFKNGVVVSWSDVLGNTLKVKMK